MTFDIVGQADDSLSYFFPEIPWLVPFQSRLDPGLVDGASSKCTRRSLPMLFFTLAAVIYRLLMFLIEGF